jgi:menaquinone-dependent protoporphyrinogen oxidase
MLEVSHDDGDLMLPPHRILLVYGTRYGHTAKVAERIRAKLAADGYEVAMTDIAHPTVDVRPSRYDSVIAGGSIIGGHHQRELERYVIANLPELRHMPTAFFSVSGSAGSTEARGQVDARRCLDDFLRKTDWNPDLTATIGGAMSYSKYSWFLRFVMKEISRRNGGPTDTTQDHELTNWHQVEEFAHAFGQLIQMPEPAFS